MRFNSGGKITEERKCKLIRNNSQWSIDFDSKSKINKAYYLDAKCKNFEATAKFSVSGLDSGNIDCQNCLNIKISNDLEKLNFNFFGKIKGKYFVGCRDCGTVQMKQATDYSKRGEVSCTVCNLNKVIEILEENNCVFLAAYVKNYSTRVVYLTQDGKENDVAAKQIKENRFAKTKNHESSYAVYMFWNVIENFEIIPDGLYFKIGIAIEPEMRLKSLNLDFPCNIKVLKEDLSRSDAIKLEKEMHKLFWWCKLNKRIPEIFTNKISMTKLSKKSKRKRHYMKDGATEWFFIPDELFNFMLRNKESFDEYDFAGCKGLT